MHGHSTEQGAIALEVLGLGAVVAGASFVKRPSPQTT